MHSQHKEEALILDYFKDVPTGFFVDVGANNGWKGSNTLCLYEKGWSGIMVEAAPDTFAELKKFCADKPRLTPVHAAVCDRTGEVDFYVHEAWCSGLSSLNERFQAAKSCKRVTVPARTLDQIVENVAKIDFLAIDAESADLAILRSFSFRIRPRLVMAEVMGEAKPFEEVMASHNYKKAFREVDNFAWEDTQS